MEVSSGNGAESRRCNRNANKCSGGSAVPFGAAPGSGNGGCVGGHRRSPFPWLNDRSARSVDYPNWELALGEKGVVDMFVE